MTFNPRTCAAAAVAAGALAFSPAASAQDPVGSATAGTAGSAAAGGTSASTLGIGATSTAPDGTTSSALGTAGSAAAADGRADTRSTIKENPHGLRGESRARAQDGGTFSRSRTRTTVDSGESVTSTTRTMSHEPGSKPVKSTTTTTSAIPEAPAP